jgi:hypothetical protein
MDDADVVRIDERDEYTIRTFAEDDRADVERLASEGLLVGHVDHSGSATEADPHGSGAGYPTPHSFWVVEAQGHVIGTIAMLDGDPDVGRLLQLRVAPAWRDDPRIAKCLVSAAVAHRQVPGERRSRVREGARGSEGSHRIAGA